MTDYLYPTAFSYWGPEEHAASARVRASGRYTSGPETAALETEFAAYHGRRYGIAVNSGSSANLIATAALCSKHDNPLVRGDSALVPALAWSTTYAPLIQHGLDLVLADCDDSWNAPANYASHATIVPRRRDPHLIVACSVLGNPAEMRGWLHVANKIGAYLLEDNCESAGARDNDDILTGRYGTLSTFSFFYSHQISAVEGGMILTDDAELAGLCRVLSNHGNAGWGSEDFAGTYNFVLHGYNVRQIEEYAAVARVQLTRLATSNAARRANETRFRALVAEAELPITLPTMHGTPAPFGLAFAVADTATRARLATALRAKGIDCRPPTGGSFARHPYGAPWRDQLTPVVDRIHDCGLFLGNAPYPIEDLIERAVLVMQETL